MADASMVHKKAVIVDGHCDTILELYKKKRSFWEPNAKGHLNWQLASAGKINAQFMAFYIEPEYKPVGSLSRVLELLDFFHSIQAEGTRLGHNLEVIKSKEQVRQLRPEDFKVLLAVEGGEVLEGRISNLRILHLLGFRSLTLTWNQRNQLADGVGERESKGGLTTFGKEVVREMNRLGMLIDVSHLNEAGFWDVLDHSDKPIAASHSCCRALWDHPRNLWDSQLKALKSNGGVMGINFYPGFLGGGKATIDRVVQHLEHAAVVAGPDHIGLGSDFDGINRTPIGLENAALLPGITERLLARGWSEEDVLKTLGGNFLRVLSQILP